MATFSKTSGAGGAWIDKKALKSGDIIKLVSEPLEQEGQNGKQIVAKARIKGSVDEPKNIAINKPTKNALIDAFGEDSKSWMNQLLTVHAEQAIFSGKRGVAVYLIPEGFEVTLDPEGYIVVKKKGEAVPTATSVEYPTEDISPEDIPF